MERAARRVLGGLAIIYIILYVILALGRITYPYELEFLEGTSLTLISRLVRGEPFYIRPTLEFIPSNYTPLYYYTTALVARLMGAGFLPLRLVSLAASIAAGALIFTQVRRETTSAFFGLLSAGLFAAAYGLIGAWYDLGRNDSLFLAVLLGGAYLVRFQPQLGWSVAAAGLIALSFFTKQTAAMMAPALILYSLLTNRRQFAVLTASLVVFVGAGLIFFHINSEGWFSYYVFKIAGLHRFTWDGFHRFWRSEMLPFYGVSLGLTVYLWVSDFRNRRNDRFFYYLLFVGSALGSSWMIRSHEGAYLNVLMPACAALALTTGIALNEAIAHLQHAPFKWRIMPWALVLVQFAVLAIPYKPGQLIPTAEDRRAGTRIVEQIAAIPGEIWMPQHGYLAERAGKRSHANGITVWDVTAETGTNTPGADLQNEIITSLKNGRFAAIIFDALPDGRPEGKPGFIDQFYRFDGRLFVSEQKNAFRPATGSKARPELVFVPLRK